MLKCKYCKKIIFSYDDVPKHQCFFNKNVYMTDDNILYTEENPNINYVESVENKSPNINEAPNIETIETNEASIDINNVDIAETEAEYLDQPTNKQRKTYLFCNY